MNKKDKQNCFCICHHQDKMIEHGKETPKNCEHCRATTGIGVRIAVS